MPVTLINNCWIINVMYHSKYYCIHVLTSILFTYTNHSPRKEGQRCSCSATPSKMLTSRIPSNSHRNKELFLTHAISLVCKTPHIENRHVSVYVRLQKLLECYRTLLNDIDSGQSACGRYEDKKTWQQLFVIYDNTNPEKGACGLYNNKHKAMWTSPFFSAGPLLFNFGRQIQHRHHHIHIYIYTYVHIYTYMYIYIYIHIH